MRILFLSTWFPYPPDNGSKIRVYHLLRALSTRHQVTLVSFAFTTARPDQADVLQQWNVDVQTVEYNPFERSSLSGALRFFSLSPVVTRPLPEMADAVQRAAGAMLFDAVIASNEVTATYIRQLPCAIVRILEEHNLLSRWMWERYQRQTAPVQRLRSWISWRKACHFEARLYRQFDLCTMVSEQDRAACLQMLPGYRGHVEVIPNGVDCQHHQFALSATKTHSLVYNGALTYQANYNAVKYFLSEIYPLVRKSVPDVTLTVTGSTSGVDRSGLQLDESVHLSGYVNDVRPFVGGSTVCVVPLQEGGGTRLKILEAMALGTPVISTAKGAEGLDAVHNEHLLIADDPAEFAEGTRRLLEDASLRRRLAANARELVERHYDWNEIGQRFVDLVESVANARGEKSLA